MLRTGIQDYREPQHCPKPLITVRSLSKTYRRTRWLSHHKLATKALDAVSLDIKEGSTLALVGESGSGKSTLARCLALLEESDEGGIWFDGKDLLSLPARQSLRARQRIQLIFQNSATALNPRLKVIELILEPLKIRGQLTDREMRARALHLMQEVELPIFCGDRRPLELSGGEQQRVALARALAVQPCFVILDEVFSGLDLPLQARITKLLARLQDRWRLTYVLISHDLALVSRMADEIAVLYRGRLVEHGCAANLLRAPQHPHTRALVAATLTFQPQPVRLQAI